MSSRAEYLKLCAIVDTTNTRKKPLRLLLGGDRRSGLWLSVAQGDKRLATVPFEPGREDDAARDVARCLTLDGKPPWDFDGKT